MNSLLVFAFLLARRRGGALRLIGRAIEGDPMSIALVLGVLGIGAVCGYMKRQRQYGV